MPVIIDRKQASAGKTMARAAAASQPNRDNRVLIFGCIAAIVLCWAFIAMQVFGPGVNRSSKPATALAQPAGIKPMELPGN